MDTHSSTIVKILMRGAVAVALAAATAPIALSDGSQDPEDSIAALTGKNAYTLQILVSDGIIPAPNTDAHLINGWGLAASGTSPWWVNDNETGFSTLYDGDGTIQTLVVAVPGAPTGIVFAGGTNFMVSDGNGATAAAIFLFASEDGTISGWNPGVPPPPLSTQAFHLIDSTPSGAIYKGLAIASTDAGNRIYATDFHNAKVDVFDETLNPIVDPTAFVDPKIPDGFAPFGIQNLDGTIFVTYAKQDADAEDDVPGQGLGFVDAYDTSGVLLGRVAQRGRLNAPWGLALAPDDFGRFSGHLLVGNFGDGKINAFKLRPNNHKKAVPRGALRGTNKKPIAIGGLWGIAFGNGATAGPTNALYFAAGPAGETQGTFGRIDPPR